MRTKPGIFFFIRFALTLFLAAGILALVGVIAYRSLQGLVNKVADEAKPNHRIILLKDIQYELSDAELNARTYSLTGESLKAFSDNINNTRKKLGELYGLSDNNPLQKYRIDSIKSLVLIKIDLMDRLIRLQEDTSLAMKDLRTLKASVAQLKKTQPAGVEPEDTKAEDKNAEPKSFLKKLFGKKNKDNNIKSEGLYDAVATTDNDGLGGKTKTGDRNDKVVETLTSHIDQISKNQQARKAERMQEELAIISQDREVSAGIRRIIGKIEREEERVSARMADMAQKNANYTTQIIFLLSVITIAVLIASGITVYTYMKVNQKYRKVLNEAKNKAERLARLRLEFLSNMSHEIRTPLNAIVGFSEQLGKQSLHSGQEQSVRIIRESSEHLANLINDVLDHAKMESGRFSFEEIAFNPVHIFEQVYDFFRYEAKRKGIDLLIEHGKNVPEYVTGDPLRLKQIMVNLVSNALKFTSRGHVKISVEAMVNNLREIVLEVKVSDTGIGIAPEKLNLIFDEYTQADSSTTRKYGGTGLGLTITRKLIELQGGTIEVQSEPRKGSTFTFAIPYALSDLKGHNEALEMKFKQPEKIKELRILVADDENYNRLLLQHIFEKWSLEIEEAVDGAEVLDKLSVEEYDLILMDVKMPHVDGIDATRRIRESFSGHKRHVPIIAVTAGASADDKKNCLSAGMNGFITKPFKETELVKVMGEVLKIETEAVAKEKKQVNGNGVSIDLTELEKLIGNDQEFLKKMIRSFIESSSETLLEMEQNLDGKDLRTVGLLAHRLAAPARHMGFHNMAIRLKKIEHYEQEKMTYRDLMQNIAELRKDIEKVNTGLQHKLEELI